MAKGIRHIALHLRHSLVLSFCLLGIASKAQTTFTLPDTNFRNFLKTKYPDKGLINSNGDLVTAAAAQIGGVVNGSNLPIQNIEGIQYFTGAAWISFVTADLRSLPTQLSSMTRLEAINVMYNQIDYLPDLRNLKRLKTLNIHSNSLQKLPALTNDSLTEVKVNNNRLDSMPDLSNLVRLQRLTLHGNKISTLKGLEKLVMMNEFWCSSNLLTSLPDLSPLKKLAILEASNNKFTSAPQLGTNSPIKTLNLANNQITFLPNEYSGYDSLTKVNLSQNKLSFKELLKLTSVPNYKTFTISPQKTFSIASTQAWTEGNAYTLSTGIDATIDGVVYDWYKNGVKDTSIVGDKYSFTFAQLSDAGKYTCQLHHPAFGSFYLQTDTIVVTVAPCLDLTAFSTVATEINCTKTGTLEVISLPASALKYILKSSSSAKTYTSTTGKFIGLTEASYLLSIQTSTGCTKTYPSEIKIPLLKCKDYLLTPDNDGNADTFYFEASGKAEIYDKRGNLVKRLSIPAEWDCTGDKGKVSNGYYIADINNGESQIGLSVVY